jgi:iron complex outermembrane receptor protein
MFRVVWHSFTSLAAGPGTDFQLASAARRLVPRQDQSTRESCYDLELQDTLSLSDSLRLVSGMNYRYDRAESETYFNRTLDDTTWRTFGQLEWRATEHWLLQGGAMFEDTQLTGSSLTPRVAVNYLITPRHGLRAVYSQAVRSPDMLENNYDERRVLYFSAELTF